jgi:hypothetical protein
LDHILYDQKHLRDSPFAASIDHRSATSNTHAQAEKDTPAAQSFFIANFSLDAELAIYTGGFALVSGSRIAGNRYSDE